MAHLLPETSRTFLAGSTSKPCPQQSPSLCLRCSQSLFSHPVLLTLASSCHRPVCRRTHGLSAQWSSTGPSACASSPYFCLSSKPSSQLCVPNQQELPAPRPPASHPNPSNSHHHGCPADALSLMSMAARQKQESRFHSEMYRQQNWGWRRSINKSVQRVPFCIPV